ncbi:efflux RND transporter periplasmic adaptor subunit [Photobacterium sagamiensis]|uniref:efflux RND transporter periplasmic adaptor subunit n=1 Tax=Photobacterium sagamiensis TaxID=2910241 RepID=UPI003D0CDD4F
MKSLSVAVLALAIGGALGYFAYQPINEALHTDGQSASSSNEPLYWVAPMDPNYKRDKPGKSPMGMDLIPVYEEDLAGGQDDVAGTVTINPAVENNLGVKVAPVLQQKLAPQIETVGYVAFDESRLWQINSRVSGWIQKLNIAAIGEKVKKGEVLFELYSPDLVRAQEELLNAKRMGKAVLVKGAKERLISLGVDSAQINQILRRGKAKRDIAIKAPSDGVIATLNVRDGAYLSPAQAVISGGSLSEVWVDAEVFERQSHWVKQGAAAEMTLDALPGQAWEGKIDYVYPVLDAKTRTLRVRLKFDNQNGDLKPNMFANITLMPKIDELSRVIPQQAVIRSGNMTRVVLALGEGKFRSTRILTGREAAGQIEVLEGLSETDKVVTSAHFLLDSESSQSADFSRMAGQEEKAIVANTAWATGTITDVMAGHRMLTIQHSPIPEWEWPAMQMNFTVKEGDDLSQLIGGESIRFLIEKTETGDYVISDIRPADAAMNMPSAEDKQ